MFESMILKSLTIRLSYATIKTKKWHAGTIKVVVIFGFVFYKGCKRKATEKLCVTPKHARLCETPDSI